MLQLLIKVPATPIWEYFFGICDVYWEIPIFRPLKVLNLVKGARYTFKKSWEEREK